MQPVLVSSPQTLYWARAAGLSIINDHTEWLSLPNRVAMVEIPDLDSRRLGYVEQLVSDSTLCMLFMPELTSDQWCDKFDLENVVMFLGGRLNWKPQRARLADCFYFFWSTCDFYRKFPDLLEIPKDQKTKCFDALLGRRKPHRDQLWNALDHDRNLVRYFSDGVDKDIRCRGNTEFEWPWHTVHQPNEAIDFTVQEVMVRDTIVSLSQILPTSIYADTCYSLVAETEHQNQFSFFTEKIVKPILAKRLFVVASGQYYLNNLRRVGFHTFDHVIDESYDLEADPWKRNQMVLDQVAYLEQQDYDDIAQKIQPILEHNFQIMMSVDWQKTMIDMVRWYVVG